MNSLIDSVDEFVTSAKALFDDPSSNVYAKKFEASQNGITQELKQLLFNASRSSRLIGRSLSRTLSQKGLSQNIISNNTSAGSSSSTTSSKKGRTKFVTSRRMIPKSEDTKSVSEEEVSSPSSARKKKKKTSLDSKESSSEDKKSPKSSLRVSKKKLREEKAPKLESKRSSKTYVLDSSSGSGRDTSPKKFHLDESSEQNSFDESSDSSQSNPSKERREICQSIIQFFLEKFPKFKEEWESTSHVNRLFAENKITAELAKYHILILQSKNSEPPLPANKISKQSRSSPELKKKIKKDTLRNKSKDTLKRSNVLFRLFGNDRDKDKDKNETSQDERFKMIEANMMDSDIGNMTLRIKKDLKFLSFENTSALNPQEIESQIKEFFGEFLKLSSQSTQDTDAYKSDHRKALIQTQQKITTFFQELIQSTKMHVASISQSNSLLSLFNRLEDEVSKCPDVKVEDIDSKLLKNANHLTVVIKNVERTITSTCLQVFYGASQIIIDTKAILKSNVDSDKESIAFHILSLVSSAMTNISSILTDLDTLHFLVMARKEISNNRFSRASLKDKNIDTDYLLEELKKQKKSDNIFEPGSINDLIIRLATTDDDNYLSIFIDSYPSFSTTEEVLEKLYEIVKIPEGKIPNEKRIFILNRIAIALYHIVSEGYHYYFDANSSKKAKELMGELAKTIEIKDSVGNLIKLFTEVERLNISTEQTIPTFTDEISSFEEYPIYSLILEKDIIQIAEQLTLIEFDLYKNIQSIELKGQSWNKEKRKCISRNVVSSIQRINRLSFWIASSILLQSKLKERARMVSKIILIANRLKDMKNYNTLMSIIAGLNMSCILRLKATFAAVPKKNLEILKQLQEIVDPKLSFKNLREVLKSGGPNQIPYIGTSLIDLTFMEDGNPDYVTVDDVDLINMEKWELVSGCIKQLRSYQNADFPQRIVRRDPLFSFLYELPIIHETVLYNLSLEREPREKS